MPQLVLDSDALSTLARERHGVKFEKCLLHLKAAFKEKSHVLVPAAVLQEQYRSSRYDQAIDIFLSRHRRIIQIVDTTRELAREAGHLQGKHRLDTRYSTDAQILMTLANWRLALVISTLWQYSNIGAYFGYCCESDFTGLLS